MTQLHRTIRARLKSVELPLFVITFAVADLATWVEEHSAVPLTSELPPHACETARVKSRSRDDFVGDHRAQPADLAREGRSAPAHNRARGGRPGAMGMRECSGRPLTSRSAPARATKPSARGRKPARRGRRGRYPEVERIRPITRILGSGRI
jgi:hypothetical protein